jgi:DNA sulfur modification protein DndB
MSKKTKSERIVLPALRGVMGEWIFYSCLMNLEEIANRIRFAEEVHKNVNLSDMIQRQLQQGRSALIAKYLEEQEERFFNSLVVATYGGDPNWHALSNVKVKKTQAELTDLADETMSSVGFLTLQGSEVLFALDGQHRLAGIKKAIKDGLNQDPFDEISVIFVAHEKTKTGLERTRRLFTTLNKTARPVSKGDIIALDEDDVMAISVRWLVEERKFFTGDKLAYVASNNLPVSNAESLTTIGNLYDLLGILYTVCPGDLRKSKPELQRIRPADDILQRYFALASDFLTLLRESFPELNAFFSAKNTKSVVAKYRGSHGGSAIFRPIGLEIFTRIISKLTQSMALSDSVELASKLPRTLDEAPFAGLMWDTSNQTISNSHKVTLREILMYMIGHSQKSASTLTERYRKETANQDAKLPEKVV